MQSAKFDRLFTQLGRSGIGAALAVSALAMSPRVAWAGCPNDAGGGSRLPDSCNLPDGRVGGYECVYRDIDGDGDVEDVLDCVPRSPLEGEATVHSKYLIMTVVYAPPGSKDCTEPSVVSYGNGSSVGTTVSAKESIAQNAKVTVSGGVGVLGSGANASVSFEKGESSTASDEMTVTMTRTSTLESRGPCEDGVNHDYDEIWLHLGAAMATRVTDPSGCTSCGGKSVEWTLDGSIGETWPVRVGELKNPETMNTEIAAAFARYDIKPEEYSEILKCDPFAYQAGDVTFVPDEARFSALPGTFPYLVDNGGSRSTRNWEMQSDSSLTTGMASEHTYKVGASVEAKGSFGGIATAALKVEGGMTWTSSNSASSTDTTSTSARLTMGTPSEGYEGPMAYYAYYDTIYKSYAFIPVGR